MKEKQRKSVWNKNVKKDNKKMRSFKNKWKKLKSLKKNNYQPMRKNRKS